MLNIVNNGVLHKKCINRKCISIIKKSNISPVNSIKNVQSSPYLLYLTMFMNENGGSRDIIVVHSEKSTACLDPLNAKFCNTLD
jgi:hypothetical protein